MDKLFELLIEIENLAKLIYLDCADAKKLNAAINKAKELVEHEMDKRGEEFIISAQNNPSLFRYVVRDDG